MVQLVIPMNGLGKRFVAEGYRDPKPLIEVWNGKRMIEYVFDCFPGITNVLCLINPDHTGVREVLQRCFPTVQIVDVPYSGKGPVDTILSAKEHISSGEVIVSYCDYGMDWDFPGFLRHMHEKNADGGIACYKGFHPHHLGPDCYAYVRTDPFEVREKQPFTNEKQSEWASSGAYYFRSGEAMKEAFQTLQSSAEPIRGEHYVSMAYNYLPGTTCVYEIQRMLQFGTPRDLRDYQMWADVFSRPVQQQLTAPGMTVLPMAGQGSRFRMVGYTTPKPFLPIRGDPMMLSALQCIPRSESLRIVGLRENPDPQPYSPAADVLYLDSVTDGQATTVMHAIQDVSDDTSLTVTACDNGALYSAERLGALMEDTTVDAIVWAFRGDTHPTSRWNPNAYAWLDVNDDMQLQAVSVKKRFSSRPNRYCIIGTMFFRRTGDYKRAYQIARERKIMTNGEYYVDNLLVPLLEEGKRIIVFPVDHYLCWGTPNDYETFTYWAGHFHNENLRASSEHHPTASRNTA
jgi:NDP-sugar pyrophosphorylase family protein